MESYTELINYTETDITESERNISRFSYPENEDTSSLHWSVYYQIELYHVFPVIVFARCVHILWYVVGLIGNTISLKIWAIPRMRRINASALYLVALTITDILYILLNIVMYLRFLWGVPSIDVPIFCELWNVLNMIPQYASQVLVLGFTVKRFISIYHPFRDERFARHQRAPKEIISIMVGVIALSLPQAYIWHFDSGQCRVPTYAHEFLKVWSLATEMAMFVIFPAINLILNILIIRASKRSLREKRKNLNERRNGHRDNQNRQSVRSSTITLLCLSFFRIITQLPMTIVFLIQQLYYPGNTDLPIEHVSKDPKWARFLQYIQIRFITESIGTSHHALSVFFFYFTTRQFREELKGVFNRNA
ncbi:hypothetical protein CHS0354_028577 [Potamilus streckersoni]|uniref:G-protein coupled receptors family 1 profile domain-containing protein n=1 Tax=Potamilus streckersoni TaxID=2493646 RepID=A0AAE0SNF5_9BIVA|nr:hypothetical protein CHS0354_028577 [Potamilus streckersoni]